MVMGFALCASVAFAQTNRISREDARKYEKAPVEATKAAVDYKASIFTKANGHDTITCFEFDNASDYTVGTIAASDLINDTTVGSAHKHSVAGDASKWQCFSSTSDFNSRAATVFSVISSAWSGAILRYVAETMSSENNPLNPQDNGFMMLSYYEAQTGSCFNTYFTLPAVARPASAKMIEVSITQSYYKYYDQCFIDYQVNGSWYAREINIDGIDMGVNDWGAEKARFVMPHALNAESTVHLRIRAYATTERGNAFGYWWAIDNVAVMALTLDQYWALNSPTKIDGFYGMQPQGMVIPMTYGVNAQNLSITDINGAHATVNAGSERSSLSQVLAGASVNVPQGDIDATVPVIINERGFYVEDYDPTSGMQSWPNEGTHTNYGNPGLPSGFQGRGLPATTAGKNFYSINLAGGNLSRNYDTILYYVTDFSTFTDGREEGYRWSHDNGIIPVGASFQSAFTDPDPNGRYFVTDNGSDPSNGGHVNMGGYAVHARFITGNDIPQGWVFRGIELIAATDRDADDMEGAVIQPVAYQDVYEDDGLSFSSLPCGIDGRIYEVDENSLNVALVENNMGYLTPDQNYKSITISFAEQPEIAPNTSYRFGYRLAADATFALAGTRSSFSYTAQNDTTYNVSFGYNGSEQEFANLTVNSRDYRYVPTPQTYLEVMAYDPVIQGYVTAWNIDNYPFIRPIVGPARPVQHATLGIDCSNNDFTSDHPHAVTVSRNDDVDLCDSQIEVVAGDDASTIIYIVPEGDHSVIERVTFDGVELQPYDDNTGEGDYRTGRYNYYDPAHPDDDHYILLSRDYWYFYVSGLAADSEHEIVAYSKWEEWDVGIDPVAANVTLGIAPNPATSTVAVDVKGIEGMVNCSILDMSGRVVYNANINAGSEHIVNVSNFPAGAYFVRVTNDTFSKIEKLIIK